MSGDNNGRCIDGQSLDREIRENHERREREAREVGAQEQTRNRLLARMAGNIAGGIEANPATHGLSVDDVADRAEKVARALLVRFRL